MRGRHPKPTHLKLVTGNPGRRPLPKEEPAPVGGVERPKGLRGKPAELWDRFIARAFWLTWADSPKALMWCHLQAEFDRAPAKMVAARITQLRGVASDLGLDPAARARLGASLSAGKSATGAEGKPGGSDGYFE